jgi:hypothetical protein
VWHRLLLVVKGRHDGAERPPHRLRDGAGRGAPLSPVDLVTLRHQVVVLCHPLRVSFHMGRHIPCLNAEESAA